jgi:hypothetical protein
LRRIEEVNILISNNVPWHYEIIESVISKYEKILNIKKTIKDKLFLFVEKDFKSELSMINYLSFINYIKNKYPAIIILNESPNFNNYNYTIHCTVIGKFNNVFFLAPFLINNKNYKYLDASILPFSESKIKSKIPTYIVQGSLIRVKFEETRDYGILEKILEKEYKDDFVIKILGLWDLNNPPRLKDFLDISKIHPTNLKKINILHNLNWSDYHKEFLDADAIIPLISEEKQPYYFKTKITSSINYGRGYNLKFFVDQDFKEAYGLNDEVCNIYDENNLQEVFELSLSDINKNII